MSRWAGESSRSLVAIASLVEAFCQMLLSTRYVVTGQQPLLAGSSERRFGRVRKCGR